MLIQVQIVIMNACKLMLGILLVLAASVFVSGQFRCQCENRDRDDPRCDDDEFDCSTQDPCFISGEDVRERDLDDNRRSLYRTCVEPNPDFPIPDCSTTMERENTNIQTGPGCIRYRMHSTNFQNIAGRFYRERTTQRFLAVCDPGEVLYFVILNHDIEPKRVCADGVSRCVDSLTRDCYGTHITTCGPMEQIETCERDIPPELTVLADAKMGEKGNPAQLDVTFKSNRKIGDCGFNIFVLCRNIEDFRPPPDCTTLRKKRDLSSYHNTDEIFKVRARRGFRVPHITVPSDAVVQYVGFTVRVVRDGIWLYKFPNIRVFQVYNRAEGYQTFKGSGPPDRDFPGFGYLQIGNGVVHYNQEGVPPGFRPSLAEEAIIRQFLNRILVDFPSEPDPELLDGFDPQEGPGGQTQCVPMTFSAQNDSDIIQLAMMNVNACNPFLAGSAQETLDRVPTPGPI